VQIPVQKKEKRKQSSQVKAQDNGRLEDKTAKR
jgi:hypothetical protein